MWKILSRNTAGRDVGQIQRLKSIQGNSGRRISCLLLVRLFPLSWPHPVAQALVAAMATLLHLRNSSSFGALSIFLVSCSKYLKHPQDFGSVSSSPESLVSLQRVALENGASHARMTLLQKKTNSSVLLRYKPTHSQFFLVYTQPSLHLVPISPCWFFF